MKNRKKRENRKNKRKNNIEKIKENKENKNNKEKRENKKNLYKITLRPFQVKVFTNKNKRGMRNLTFQTNENLSFQQGADRK